MTERRVLLVDDHRLVAVAVGTALRAHGYETQVCPSPDRDAVLEELERFGPDCVLLDLHLGTGGADGLALVAPCRSAGAEVVLLTSERDVLILAACLEAGAKGWVRKDAEFDEIHEAIERALSGQTLVSEAMFERMLHELREQRRDDTLARAPFEALTQREQSVLRALMDGDSAEVIAANQFVSLATVRTQIRSLLQKLGVRSQLAAVAQARKVGWGSQAAFPAERVHQF